MNLKKAIIHKKEHRKEYRGAKSVDPMCRNHKGCDWCKGNRTYQSTKQKQKTDEILKEMSFEKELKKDVYKRHILRDKEGETSAR